MFKIITPEMKINRSHYLMDNLVAYYDFSAGIGGKLVDKSGNEFHGELFNMNPSSSWNTGYDGHCLQFTLSPVGQMVKSHEAKNAAAFVGYAPGTVIALAYRMNNWATSQFRGIVSKRENSPSYDWSFRCNKNYLSALTSGPVSVNANISTPYRQWFVGAAVFAPNSTTIYQNGIIVGNGSRGNVSNTNTPIIIGNGIHTNATDATGFDGYIGKIIIFNRALINEEIKEISERILSQRTYDFYEKPSARIFVYGTACPKSKIEIPSYSFKNRLETGNFAKQNISIEGRDIIPGDIELNDLSWDTVYSKINDISVKTESKNWDMWVLEENNGVNILSWGWNTSGQLGDNTITNKSSPVLIAGNHEFVDIAHGAACYNNQFIAALKKDGSAWAWGRNFEGQLGDNTITNKSSPISVVGNHSFIKISSGENNTLALKKDGSVWAWGNNASGQLGNNTTTNRSSPVSIVGNHSFIEIMAGSSTCAALKADGSVWTWGLNNYGQLGNNSLISSSSPVSITGNHSFIAIFGNGQYFMGLKEDGSVWAWGLNNVGQLGTGNTSNYSSPVSIIGGHSFKAISCGYTFAMALKEDGTVWTWGEGTFGALGDNTTISKSSPIAVVGNHKFVQIFAGNKHAFALKEDGRLWGWGEGAYGKLGNNSTTNKSSPIAITNDYRFIQIRAGNNTSFGISPRLSQPIKALKCISNSTNKEKKIMLSSNYEDLSTPFSSWKYRQKLTIMQLPNSDLSNFPVLVSITDEENQVFKKAMNNGYDIYFGDINGINEYPCEIETFSNELGNRKLLAWVKIPTISSSGTEFYMYYGGRKRTNNPKDAWDSNFVGVWHLGDSGNDVLDSTGNNDMTKTSNAPVEVDGKINKAQQFDRTNRTYAECSTPDALAITDDLTMQAWIYPFETTGTNTQFIMARNTITTNIYYGIYRTNGTTNLGYVNVYIHGQAAEVIGISTPYPVNNWYHLVVTYSKPTLKTYLNGELVNTTSINPTGTGEGNFINIGARSNTADGTGSALGFNGNIDEVRISNIARNADWITTEYANQNDPDAFLSIGGEEIGKRPAVYLRYDDHYGHNPAEITITGEKKSGLRTQKPVLGEEPDFSLKMTNNLSALYLFNEGKGDIIHDCSKNGRHGTIVTPRHNSWDTGKYGSRLYCDVPKRIEIPNASEVFGTSNNSLTISVIGQLSNATTSYRNILGALNADGTTWGYNIWFHYEINNLRQYASIRGSSGNSILSSTTAFSSYNDLGGPPICFTVSYEYEKNQVSIYRNNLSLSKTATQTRAHPYPGSPLYLGCGVNTSGTPTYGLFGWIHSVAIWQRGLTSSEIMHLHRYPWCIFNGYPGHRELKLKQ